jgi:hypothetical protein
MEKTNTGGPAFPYPDHADEGMTLRDYFAAKAMELQSWHNEGDNYSNHADRCYSMADAMVRAREA